MGRLKQIVLDCRQPASLARFWEAALDDFEVRPYDAAEIARLATLGRTPETDPGVILDGPALEICFQEVDTSEQGSPRLHVDIQVADRASDTARLVALGASVVEEFASHTWMRDPEGNAFCLTDS